MDFVIGVVVLLGGVACVRYWIRRGKLALTCRRCKTLAYPISGTKNRYRCDRCGNQFAGHRHGM